ncbi:MAG TPA: beta-propeller fold lactonase family protein [Candidatus Limnocylindria bacterium]|nr:beta-propeller fold lactonase family protein [Candidatus Limnocylindria bacterium]
MSRVILTLAAFVAVLLGPASVAAAAEGSAGAVYTLTNTAANAVIVYERSASGALTWSGTFPTGGSGGPLGSQGAVVISDDGRWLYAVDAGSNDVAVFEITKDGLTWSDRIVSGGAQPVSVTTSHDLVYVVNAASSSIAGFRSNDGKLSPIAGSIRTFAGSGAAQIQFSPSGRALVVSEKTTSTLDVFIVGKDGAAGPATSYASSGTTPFGFAFGRHEDLVVSEAAGAAPLSAASSYELSKDGTLTAISRSIPTTQAAACWVAVTKDGRYAFTANAASDSISTFSVDKDGALTLVFAQAAHSTGAHTTDMALTENSSYLYANDGGTHMISAFRVGADGSLTRLPGVTIPVGASGLAAR